MKGAKHVQRQTRMALPGEVGHRREPVEGFLLEATEGRQPLRRLAR